MEYKSLRITTTVFMVLLLLSPIIATVIGMLLDGTLFNSEKNQFASFQVIVMALYCAPAIIVSIAAREFGSRALLKNSSDLGVGLYLVSILSSVIGIGLMMAWTINATS